MRHQPALFRAQLALKISYHPLGLQRLDNLALGPHVGEDLKLRRSGGEGLRQGVTGCPEKLFVDRHKPLTAHTKYGDRVETGIENLAQRSVAFGDGRGDLAAAARGEHFGGECRTGGAQLDLSPFELAYV